MSRHEFDAVSLVFGGLFTLIAVVGVFEVFTLQLLDLRWLMPAALMLIGLAILLSASRTSRSSELPDTDDAR